MPTEGSYIPLLIFTWKIFHQNEVTKRNLRKLSYDISVIRRCITQLYRYEYIKCYIFAGNVRNRIKKITEIDSCDNDAW